MDNAIKMDNAIMNKAMELLEQLASNLGVTIEYLWETLVRQKYVEGITNIVMAIIGVVAIIILIFCIINGTKFANNKYKELAEDRRENGTGYCGSYNTSSETEDFYNIISKVIPIFGLLIIFLMIKTIKYDISYGIQQLLNPDYFALKEILDTISCSLQ